mmetsp:Transcript_34266/g.51704  ORF Transcript_34266/g.51704 Transcript_34266/m.51704 type:complete len:121 (+) Transcript_34266:62-424(+)
MLARQSQLHCHRLIIRHNNQFSIVYNKRFATTTKKLNFKMAEAEDTTSMPTGKSVECSLRSREMGEEESYKSCKKTTAYLHTVYLGRCELKLHVCFQFFLELFFSSEMKSNVISVCNLIV